MHFLIPNVLVLVLVPIPALATRYTLHVQYLEQLEVPPQYLLLCST